MANKRDCNEVDIAPKDARDEKKFDLPGLAMRASKIGATGLSLAAISYLSILGVERATDPPDGPSIHWVSDRTTCENSDFIVIHNSGTGKETGEHIATNNRKLIESFGGCAMYLVYGYTYQPAESAKVLSTTIEAFVKDANKRKLVLIGSSFGGIAWEEIATHPAVRDSPFIDILAIVMESSPTSMKDVKGDILGLPASDVANLRIPIIRPFVLANNLLDIIERKDDINSLTVKNAAINAAETRPQLVDSQLAETIRGLGPHEIRSDVRIFYIHSPKTDDMINTVKSLGTLRRMTNATITELAIEGAGHATSWLDFKYDKTKPAYEEVLRWVSDIIHPPQPSGGGASMRKV